MTQSTSDSGQFDEIIIGDTLPRRGNKYSKRLARAILVRLGWRLEGKIVNLPKLVLIGAPHTSNWDLILTIGAIFALGLHVSWIAKHTIFRWPLGVLLRWLGGIGIDRRSTKGFVEKMATEIQSRDKILLALMPEGTRSKVQGWRSGFYYIAHQSQVPIYPIVFDYGRKILGFGPAFYPTGDYEADLPQIKAYFTDATGYNPAQTVQ